MEVFIQKNQPASYGIIIILVSFSTFLYPYPNVSSNISYLYSKEVFCGRPEEV